MMKRIASLVVMMLAAIAVSGFVVTERSIAQSDALTMLRQLPKGEWTVRFRDGTASSKICIRNGDELIQLQAQHRIAQCSRFVLDDEANEVTVQYTCRGDGYGRTHIRRETSSLVQIESQGIAGGQPFQFSAEARRSGNCT